MILSNNIGHFPPQKLSDSDKNEDWYKKNVDSAMALIFFDDHNHKHKMNIYANLDNDIIDQNEIEKVFNPLDIEYAAFPAALKNYPLVTPKIDLLQGEELVRTFDYTVRAMNSDTYSTQQSQLQKMLMETLLQELTANSYDEQEAQQKLQKFSKYTKYEWKDSNELTATRILQYLWREQNLQNKFNNGIRKALVMGQEIYRVDIVGNEPVVVECDPRNVYSLRRGSSEKIEDSDIIVELNYSPLGAVIDEFYEDLSEKDITDLENGRTNNLSNSGPLNYQHSYPVIYSNLETSDGQGFAPLTSFADNASGMFMPYDKYGNVRIVRCRWVGRRKVGKLTFFDDNGDEQEKLVPEDYKINKSLGEIVKWLWINEAYQATLIGNDKYIKTGPREVQMRHFDNISKCFLGYVGTDYGKSLMSRMEPYQYIYNVYMRRLELVLSKYKGPIYELDPSKIPDEWDMDKWMYYADVLGWAVVDPFNEGKKGAATGKLSGNFNTTGKVLDPNVGNYIQQIIGMLQYIENQMGEICGVNKQRLGQIENRETVGGVERAVSQSSHITEKWFFVHDETKRRVLHALLDTAKYIWKKLDSKKLNFVLDDMSRVFLEFNPVELASSEFDLFISNSRKDAEIKQILHGLAQAGIQNGLGMGPMIQALREESITAMARILDDAEEASYQRQADASKQQSEMAQQQMQYDLEKQDKELQFNYYKVDQEIALKKEELNLKIAELNNTDDVGEMMKIDIGKNKQLIEQEKNRINQNKINDDNRIKQSQLHETIRHNKTKEELDLKKINKPNSNK